MKYVIMLLAIGGLVVSTLALRVHIMDPNAAPPCAVSEHWDCGVVNHSRYAVFPAITSDEKPGTKHIPVAAIGMAGYALIAVAALLGRLWIVLELVQFGFMCAAFLTYIEAYVLETWCIYCVWSQGITAALLAATIVALLLRRRGVRQAGHLRA